MDHDFLLGLWILHLQSKVATIEDMHAYVEGAVDTKVTEVESVANEAKDKAEELEAKVDDLEQQQ